MPDRLDDEMYDAKQQAVSILMGGGTTAQAALVVGVSERTVQRWLAGDKIVRMQLIRERQLTLEATAIELSRIGLEAVGVLREIMLDEAAPKGVRVKAAGEVLEHMVTVDEHATLAHRIMDIEKRLGLVKDVQEALIDSTPEAQQLLLAAEGASDDV